MILNEYMDIFIEEAKEHLQNLNSELLNLEQNPNKSSIDEIFRAAHTLKGMSATMGFEQVSELTHKMENVLDLLRSDKLAFSQNLCDVLFKCVDALEKMINSIVEGSEDKYDISELVVLLSKHEEGEAPVIEDSEQKQSESLNVELDKYEINIINIAQDQNMNVYHIHVLFDEQCVMKSVRAFMISNSLERLGEIIKTIPTAEDIEEEKFDDEIIVFLATNYNSDDINKELNKISEISVKEIKLIDLEQEIEVTEDANPKEENKKEATKNNKLHQTVRVDIGKLDKLMNLVGELVINKTRLEQLIKTNDTSSLHETIEQVDRITSDLQNIVMDVRMVPIEQVFNRFPRMVRDLAKELGKEVNLSLEGKETELDRTVIDEIGDPLVHLIRNSMDHGIENPSDREKNGKPAMGNLSLIAKQEGNSIIIIVEDDGNGINIEKVKQKAIEKGIITEQEAERMDENSLINLILSPGFSTADKVSDVSGRGVGLDVVKSKINSLSGSISIESKTNIGSRFTIKLPLTLAIIQALMVKVEDETFAIPLANIDETTSIKVSDIKNIQGQEVMVLRGNVLPLLRLTDTLNVPIVDSSEKDELFVVIARRNDQQIGLVVNELIGQQEIVISSLGKLLNGIPGISGAAILGDGTVSLILDVNTLF
ncbi:two-component system, chemotaxis family, sensor kinase CheA [Desulfonispora thiosulfatigenes DSM 11270]|uniref:Chemotaxis protein CheA n=1 Tax=Desulfonispora thiosulfatigenes DSM 11270 TaxID=656914 RepID=A0A1W1VTN4_DESTI|nr:chemotaxis protein CheA [Desulfonispora thiosulfatigenes]SMB96633.1 two-component system, chemotaxis family, sensor kinase CheA [Desulfonispora thiosulfatigenes DSM 11270]